MLILLNVSVAKSASMENANEIPELIKNRSGVGRVDSKDGERNILPGRPKVKFL